MKTIEEIKNDSEFNSGISFREFDFSVFTLYQGTEKLQYFAFWKGELLFTGNDFRPSPLHEIDSLEAICLLLGFLTLQPGDADKEYFKKYTTKQMEWAKSFECEQLKSKISDFEDRDSEYCEETRRELETLLQ